MKQGWITKQSKTTKAADQPWLAIRPLPKDI
jgi:hypothetical protein